MKKIKVNTLDSNKWITQEVHVRGDEMEIAITQYNAKPCNGYLTGKKTKCNMEEKERIKVDTSSSNTIQQLSRNIVRWRGIDVGLCSTRK